MVVPAPVALTKTAPHKDRKAKGMLVEKIRNALDEYKHLYVFSFHNMRTNKFKDVRPDVMDSRFFLGKNKVMQLALGRSATEEYKENLHLMSRFLAGNVGMLAT